MTNKVRYSKEYKELLKQLDVHEKIKETLEDELPILEAGARQMAEQVNSANEFKAVMGSTGKLIKKGAKDLWSQRMEFMKSLGAVRDTEKSMGILSKQADGFRDNIYAAARNTNELGISTKDLAKMQGGYSQQVGRSVMLTKDGLQAMAELASGTMLGVDGAAEMAANMEEFGISATGTKDVIEEMLDVSHKMGVNSSKAIKNLQQNLRLANKYHFKGGVKGITRMSVAAAKLKLDIDGIAGMADKVFRPEGAVEMAAKLQTMGGEFAKMANPFEMMFKARNDFEGFAKEIGAATKEFVQYNKESGEFDISGLMLDRMREISSITGIGVEKLAEMGKAAKKFEMIGQMLSPNIDDESKEFITSMAQLEDGEWVINMGDGKQSIESLNKMTKAEIKAKVEDRVKEKQNLAERAKQAQTFDQTWLNLVNSMKEALLPMVEAIDKNLKPIFQDLTNYFKKEGVLDTFSDFAKSAGELASGMIKWVVDNPLTAIIGGALFKAAQWIMNGVSLGIGFNSVASVGGGMGGGMGGGGRGLGFGGKLGKGLSSLLGGKGTMAGRGMRNLTAMGSGMSGMAKFGGGLALGGLGMGMDYTRSQMDDPTGLGGQALGVGSSAMTGAGMGMMLGPVGAIVGGILGAGYGLYDEWANKAEREEAAGRVGSFDDYIVQDGKISTINPNDTNIGVKDGGVVDKLLDSETNVPGNLEITFKPLKIEFGTIKLEGGSGQSVDMDITSDPLLMRELSNVIQQELRKAIGGGKLNPNPIG